ncbi:succinate dehydrogenase flavoprotein subunit [compost metagenome]
MSSGSFAGDGAAEYARRLGPLAHQRKATGLSALSLQLKRSKAQEGAYTAHEYVEAVQAEVAPYDRNLFRSEAGLKSSLERLNTVWHKLREDTATLDNNGVKLREAAAMTATARWMYHSALARQESRGMHKREDYPHIDQAQHHRLISSGLDEISVRPEPVAKEAVLQ